jgi:hypothetical protein
MACKNWLFRFRLYGSFGDRSPPIQPPPLRNGFLDFSRFFQKRLFRIPSHVVKVIIRLPGLSRATGAFTTCMGLVSFKELLMKFSKKCAAICMALGLLAVAAPARAALVSWDVDPAQSFVRLNIPDQQVTVDTTTATIRIRAANSATWSDTTGRRAFLDGEISSNLVDGASIAFNGGSNNLFALETGSFRPNPAQFDPNATNADNPDGQYTGTGGVAAAYAAKVRGSVSILTLDLAFIAFRDVFFDIASGVLALDGGGAFAGGANNFGIDSALLDVDGLNAAIVGQVIPDVLSEPLSGLSGLNTGGGVVTNLGGLDRKLTITVSVPISIDLEGTIVTASATGTIVAFATLTVIPEPSSVLLAGFAAFGLIWAGRRRIRRN